MWRSILLLTTVLATAVLPYGRASDVQADAAAVAPPYYAVTDLGTLGGTWSMAFDINAAGQVAGQAATADGPPHAFLWSGGAMADLGLLPGYADGSLATALDDAGRVVGWSSATETLAAFRYDGGALRDLGSLGGYYASAHDLNAAGQVVGSATTAPGAVHAFLHEGGAMRDLGTLNDPAGAETSTAYGINGAGEVVGVSSVAGPVFYRAFRWTPAGGMVDLGTLGGSDSWANAINDAGQVVGWAETGTAMRAFRWTAEGGMRDLGALPDRPHSAADALNGRGQAVGYVSAGLPDARAAFFANGAVIDLNTMIPAEAGWVLAQATGINDAGQIVGVGEHAGQARAFLLTPTGAAGAFCDVAPGAPYAESVATLAVRGAIRGYEDGCFGPHAGTQRAQMAALIARALGWDQEDWGNNFTDRDGLNADLWRNAGTLQHYGVAKGYGDDDCRRLDKVPPCFGPTNPVTSIETIAVIARAMQAKGYWTPQVSAPAPDANVPAVFAGEVATFHHYTQGRGGIPAPPSNWNAQATRGWFALALWQALTSYGGPDRVP